MLRQLEKKGGQWPLKGIYHVMAEIQVKLKTKRMEQLMHESRRPLLRCLPLPQIDSPRRWATSAEDIPVWVIELGLAIEHDFPLIAIDYEASRDVTRAHHGWLS